MQAIFRFNGSEEIVISNQPNGVMVEIYHGMEPGHHGAINGNGVGESHRMTECSNETCGVEPMQERTQTMLVLSKSEGRSVASAIMGAAAER